MTEYYQEYPLSGTDDEDVQSAATSDFYSDHEPFATFQDRILRLCHTIWPGHTDDGFSIERMKGGASNRLFGIRVAGSGNQEEGQNRPSGDAQEPDLPPGEYVLRVPRWAPQTSSHEVAMLRFLKERITAKIPAVVRSDTGSGEDNPLGSPYVLQRRVPGVRLDDAWPSLNHAQRLLVARDLARLHAELGAVSNPSGGIPDVERDPLGDGSLATIDYRFPGEEPGARTAVGPREPVEMLCARLGRWADKYGAAGEPWVRAAEIVRQTQAANRTFSLSPDGGRHPYYFNHGDLYPRNIMVQTPDETSASVSGVLHWGDAHFAPAVVAFAPPAWLWMAGWWRDFDDEGYLEEGDLWRAAHEEPADQESREIKLLFEAEVGSGYVQCAYSPDAYAARKIWKAAFETEESNWTKGQLEVLYTDWRAGQNGTGSG